MISVTLSLGQQLLLKAISDWFYVSFKANQFSQVVGKVLGYGWGIFEFNGFTLFVNSLNIIFSFSYR